MNFTDTTTDTDFDTRLWDATPGVCCPAFQLGACEHTEVEPEAPTAEPQPVDLVDDEPF